MSRTPVEILDAGLSAIDPALHPLTPLLAGGAAMLALVERDVESLIDNALPATAQGAWLDLVAEGFGLRRQASELDPSLKARIAASPKMVTLKAIKDAVDAILGNLGTCVIAEHHRTQLYCAPEDDDSPYTEYVTDAYCDEANLIGEETSSFIVICPEGLTEAMELSICAAVRSLKPLGYIAWVLFSNDYTDLIYGDPWEEA